MKHCSENIQKLAIQIVGSRNWYSTRLLLLLFFCIALTSCQTSKSRSQEDSQEESYAKQAHASSKEGPMATYAQAEADAFDSAPSAHTENNDHSESTSADGSDTGEAIIGMDEADSMDWNTEDETFIEAPRQSAMTPEFCMEWNPEYSYRKNQCCAQVRGRNRRFPKACAPQRRSGRFCREMTHEQLQFTENDLDTLSIKGIDQQAFCSANAGFLAQGIPLLETPNNRIKIANPRRCANFGTSGLVLLLHTLGKAVHQEFKGDSEHDGLRLVVGDISAPRGGCLGTGKKSHSGHTNGLDADVAFLKLSPGRDSSHIFHRDFDPVVNWWLLKKIREISPVCIGAIFIDRKHIASLERYLRKSKLLDNFADTAAWSELRPLLRHVGGHRNHFHFRVGVSPKNGGSLNCKKHSRDT